MKKMEAPTLRWAALALCLSALGLAGCSDKSEQQAGQAGPVAVDVVTLNTESVDIKQTFAGRVNAYREAEIRPQVSGIIQKRAFTEGSEVKQGDLLYQIDPAEYKAALASAKGSLAVAQANEKSARLLAQRYSKLVKSSAISKQEADDAQAAWSQARAQIAQDRANVDAAQIDLDHTRLIAPIPGIISRSAVTEGALVTDQQTTPLATIRQISPIYVDIQIPAEVLMMQKSQKDLDNSVSIKLKNGVAYPEAGKIQFSEVSVDTGTGTVNLRATFDNADHLLLPGTFVNATMVVQHLDNAVMAPQQSIQRQPNGDTLAMVVGADNKVESRKVELGEAVGDKWVVISGLKDGEKVVVAGLQKIQPGATVKPQDKTTQQAAQ